MPNRVTYRPAGATVPNTNANPSDTIWNDCPFTEIRNGDRNGTAIWDNFDETQNFGALPTTEGIWGRYKFFSSATATVAQVSDTTATASTGSGSGMKITAAGTDNLSFYLTQPCLPFNFGNNLLAASPISTGKLWFECRVALADITATTGGTAYIGFLDQRTHIVGDPLAVGDTFITGTACNFVGFKRPVTAVTWDAGYNVGTVTSGVMTIHKAGIAAVAAAAYVKLGLIYDPLTNAITFFANGVPYATKKYLHFIGAASSGTLNTTGSEFPDNVQMGLSLGVMQGSTHLQALTIDWWRAAQLYTG